MLRPIYRTFDQNFNFNLRRDIKKIPMRIADIADMGSATLKCSGRYRYTHYIVVPLPLHPLHRSAATATPTTS